MDKVKFTLGSIFANDSILTSGPIDVQFTIVSTLFFIYMRLHCVTLVHNGPTRYKVAWEYQ